MSVRTGKEIIASWAECLYDFDKYVTIEKMQSIFDDSAVINMSFPFKRMTGAIEFFEEAIHPLSMSFEGLERRETIRIGGVTNRGDAWVGCCGYYTGNFECEFLNIQPTHKQAAMRYHEFFRIHSSKVCEVQGIWDLPELMLQANCWPMVPSLGREWQVPAPATLDGIKQSGEIPDQTSLSLLLVENMLDDLGKFETLGVEGMKLHSHWHPKCSWYGPSGIGTSRGIDGFRRMHQIPFLNAMPDRRGFVEEGHLFADGNYVGFTAWPGMQATISGNGWLGIAASKQKITMRSLDFWRCENGKIRENWVLVDLLDVFNQIGVDVLGRMREMNPNN